MKQSSTPERTARLGIVADLVRDLRQTLTSEGGFTFDHRSGELCQSGVAVCVEPATALSFPLVEWVDERVAEWLERCLPRLAAADVHVGGWHDRRSGQVWLDLVRVFPPDGRDSAAALGTTNKQMAIFDLGRGCEIWLEHTAVRA